MTVAPESARFPPDSASAPAARRFVAEVLRGWALADLVDDAALATTELVGNAVLHARTEIEVRVARSGPGVRILVADRSPAPVVVPGGAAGAGPEPPPPGDGDGDLGSTTGRGLMIVAALASRWQVVPGHPAKHVWFELGTAPEAGEPAVAPPDPPAAAGLGRVTLLDLPLALVVESEENLDQLVREFQLMALGRGGGGEVPGRLARLMEEVLVAYAEPRHAARRRTAELLAAGVERAPITVMLPVGAAGDLRRLHALVTEADAYCRAGDLLTLASSAPVERLRAWIVDEVAAQLGGAAPRPCTL